MGILQLLLCMALGVACPGTRLFEAGQAVEARYYACQSRSIDAAPTAIALGRRQDGSLVWERGLSLYVEGEPSYPEPQEPSAETPDEEEELPLPSAIVPVAFFTHSGRPPLEVYRQQQTPNAGDNAQETLAWLAADAKRPEAQEFTLYEFTGAGMLRESLLAIRAPADYRRFRAEVDQVPAQHRRPTRVYSDAEKRQFPSFVTRHANSDWMLYSVRMNESQCTPIRTKEDYLEQHEATVRFFQ